MTPDALDCSAIQQPVPGITAEMLAETIILSGWPTDGNKLPISYSFDERSASLSTTDKFGIQHITQKFINLVDRSLYIFSQSYQGLSIEFSYKEKLHKSDPGIILLPTVINHGWNGAAVARHSRATNNGYMHRVTILFYLYGELPLEPTDINIANICHELSHAVIGNADFTDSNYRAVFPELVSALNNDPYARCKSIIPYLKVTQSSLCRCEVTLKDGEVISGRNISIAPGILDQQLFDIAYSKEYDFRLTQEMWGLYFNNIAKVLGADFISSIPIGFILGVLNNITKSDGQKLLSFKQSNFISDIISILILISFAEPMLSTAIIAFIILKYLPDEYLMFIPKTIKDINIGNKPLYLLKMTQALTLGTEVWQVALLTVAASILGSYVGIFVGSLLGGLVAWPLSTIGKHTFHGLQYTTSLFSRKQESTTTKAHVLAQSSQASSNPPSYFPSSKGE